MERTIGNLGEEIPQPSNPFANLSRRSLLRCQVNALKSMVPALDPSTTESLLPRGACNLGDGFLLLRARDRYRRAVDEGHIKAFHDFFGSSDDYQNQDHSMPTVPKIYRWARLRLPNGQIARSAWKEKLKPPEHLRIARNVKLNCLGKTAFAEVQYYFLLNINNNERCLALVLLYTDPDPDLLKISSKTLWSCKYQGSDGLKLIDVKSIVSVVAMIPHQPYPHEPVVRAFVVEKPGLEIASWGGDEVN